MQCEDSKTVACDLSLDSETAAFLLEISAISSVILIS